MREIASSGLPWFWLDGSGDAAGGSGYLGVASEVRIAERGREREFLEGLRAGSASRASLPGDGTFRSGWVVALGYEFGVGLMGVDPAPDEAPSGFALRVDEIFSVGGDREQELRRARKRFQCAARTARPSQRLLSASQPLSAHYAEGSASADTDPTWRQPSAAYEENVRRCLEAIRDGDAYVLCLTDTAVAHGDFDPLSLYARLRERGSALRGGVIVAGERALVSSSPERFLSVRGRRVETHPIKGTRRRSADPTEDAALAAELAADPKERAENLMIVDLMRNDLSRVCDPGSVAVEGFLRVESHPHVHQLVSTVTGRLGAGRDVFDAIEACFPGGSMTGAPKRSSVEILGRLEGAPRGLYSGCYGWIDDSGDAELAMTIRGVELRGLGGERVEARIGAGGGVTADSDPERELAERDLKAAPLISALYS